MKNIDAEIQQIYERMVPEIQKEIESFYQRYADKEGISLAEAKKRVSKFDVRAFEARAAKMVKERDFGDEANELMRLYNATMRINRLELLKADIGLHMIDGFDDLEKLTGERLTEEAVKEFERQAGILGNGVKGASERAKSLVGQSFMNATFSERIWSNQEALRNKLSTILTKGLIGGKSYQSLAAEIRKDFSVSAREAMRLVRTEMVRVQTQAQIDSYKANGWEEFEFLAYGTASCEICNALNKKHFKISDFKPAENAPPMHPNCRCRTAPYEDEEEYQKWLDSFGNGKNEGIGSPSGGGTPIGIYKAGSLVLESLLGKPMTHEEADSGNCNPNHNGTKNDPYSTNCQSCVPVYELRRRGYNVEALPRGTIEQQVLADGEWNFWKNADGTACRESDTIKPPKANMSPNEMASWMNDIIGEGQRFSWSFFYGTDCGHIITIYKENGKLRMYDPQSNTNYTGEQFLVMLKEYGKRKNRLFRLDNKLPMAEYAGGIMKEHKK